MLKSLNFMLLGVCALMLPGCAQLVPVEPVIVRQPASLREPCPDLPRLADGSRGAVLTWIIGTQRLYAICASRQLRSTEAAEGVSAADRPVVVVPKTLRSVFKRKAK